MILNKIEVWLSFISKLAVIGLMMLMTADTILRYFFNSPLSAATALSTDIFMIMIVFFSLPFSFSSDGQIRITFIRDRLNKPVAALMETVFCILAGFVWLLITIQYIQRLIEDIETGIPASVAFVVPRIIPDVVIAIGAFVLTVRLVVTCIKQFRLWLHYLQDRNAPDGKELKN